MCCCRWSVNKYYVHVWIWKSVAPGKRSEIAVTSTRLIEDPAKPISISQHPFELHPYETGSKYLDTLSSSKIVYSKHWNTMNILYNEWREFTSTTPLLFSCPRVRGTPKSELERGRGRIRQVFGPIYGFCCERRKYRRLWKNRQQAEAEENQVSVKVSMVVSMSRFNIRIVLRTNTDDWNY